MMPSLSLEVLVVQKYSRKVYSYKDLSHRFTKSKRSLPSSVLVRVVAWRLLPSMETGTDITNEMYHLGTLVAKSAGVPEGHKVTSHPSVKEQLEDGKQMIL
jgi:hypothetical protein